MRYTNKKLYHKVICVTPWRSGEWLIRFVPAGHLLSALTNTQNTPVELRRRYQTNFIWVN